MNIWCHLICIVLVCVPYSVGEDRKMTYQVNPGCPLPCAAKLVYVRGGSPNDTMHHVWDFTFKPSILLATTSPSAELKVDWDNFGKPGSVNFTETPNFVFGVVFDQIIEYNDVNNTGFFDPKSTHNDLIDKIDFQLPQVELNNGVYGTSMGNISDEKWGQIKLTLGAMGTQGHSSLQPHLFHTENTTEVDLVLSNLTTHFNHSRFAVNLTVVSTNSDPTFRQIKMKSLDDEHSPGVFTVAEILSPEADKDNEGYLQWRTVSYTSKDRSTTNLTDVTDSTIEPLGDVVEVLQNSIMYSYFGLKVKEIPTTSFVVSFGTRGDGFYAATRYNSWNFLIGIGRPAEESFSMLVILILAIGIGIPAILILFGAVFIIGRRIGRKRDELFFTQ